MMSLKERLDNFKESERRKQETWKLERLSYMTEPEYKRKQFQTEVEPHLRHATNFDYLRWLRGYMIRGGNPTHSYDYKFSNDFYVATGDFKMMPLYGTMSVKIIVPPHVNVDVTEGIGHCNLYYLKDFTCKGGWVPVYEDTNFEV